MLGDFALADSALAELPPVYQSAGASLGGSTVAGVAGSSVGTAVGRATVVGQGGSSAIPFDWFQTVISQYANSPVLLTILANFAQNVDPTANLDAFFFLMRNLDTAEGYGLDVWGRIVGIPNGRVLTIPATDFFGFQNSGGLASGDSWDAGTWFAGGQLTENFSLTDDSFRTLILAKALANITEGSVQGINKILMTLFGDQGNAYCTDGEDMTMTYTFSFVLSPVDLAIMLQTNILPKPVGVALSIVQP